MAGTGALVDSFGRQVRKLRLSITDRCNFRCQYCLPEEPTWLPKAEILTFEELTRLVRILAPEGVSSIRLTGGEPLLRRDVADLVRAIRTTPGVKSLAMTTNGYHLAEQAKALAEAGLMAVTVSLDALEPELFRQMVRRDVFAQVLQGLDAALAAGFRPLKVNAVIMRGVNEEQVLAFAELARSGPYVVRFIEYMPLDSGNAWEMGKVLPGDELRRRIHERFPIEPVAGEDRRSPARRFQFCDGRGEVGFICSVTAPFCDRCDRIRVTADGKVLNCLFGTVEYDLRALLRSDATDADILARIRTAITEKGRGHLINQQGFQKPSRSMAAIGG